MDSFEMRRVFGILAIGVAAALCACTGPRPIVVKREVIPPRSPEAPHTVLVTIRNTGWGEGQVEAIARLRSTTTGQTAAQSVRPIELSSLETIQVRFELKAPAGDEYDAIVDVKYPP
jgi:hypothetical protein